MGIGEVEAQSAQLPRLDQKGTRNAGWRKAGGRLRSRRNRGGGGPEVHPPSPWASTIV